MLSRWFCSFNPARLHDFVKAPRLLGSSPSYWLLRLVATTDPSSFPTSPLPASATCSGKLMCCPCGRSLSYVVLVLGEPIVLDGLASFLFCEVARLSCCISLACVHCCPPVSVSCASWPADLFMLCADALHLPCFWCCARLVKVTWQSR